VRARLFRKLTPALRARRLLLSAVRPVERTETIAVEQAFGRVAAKPVRSPVPVPAFSRATWDGYALRSADSRGAAPARPRRLRVVGEVFAEQTYPGRLGPGEAVAIATGGAVPKGADAVEIFEEVRRRGPWVELRAPVPRGGRIAPAGDDFPRGALLARRGELLRPALIGALAASGVARVRVYARPRVAIVPNGNELRPPGSRLGPGEIFESNNASLSAFVAACGGDPRPYRPVRDDPASIARVLREALRSSDLVLATGGSSVGERDHLPRLFPRFGRMLFHGIAVRPGKPTLAAEARGKLLVGLPGHPTSCLLNMHWLVLPVLRRLARLPGPGWSERRVRLATAAAAPSGGLATVVPLRLDGPTASSTFRGSSLLSSLRGTSAFTILPPGRSARAGATVRAWVLEPPLGPPTTR
jgi:molybdenum cofactor synthesis domain-containing protein